MDLNGNLLRHIEWVEIVYKQTLFTLCFHVAFECCNRGLKNCIQEKLMLSLVEMKVKSGSTTLELTFHSKITNLAMFVRWINFLTLSRVLNITIYDPVLFVGIIFRCSRRKALFLLSHFIHNWNKNDFTLVNTKAEESERERWKLWNNGEWVRERISN